MQVGKIIYVIVICLLLVKMGCEWQKYLQAVRKFKQQIGKMPIYKRSGARNNKKELSAKKAKLIVKTIVIAVIGIGGIVLLSLSNTVKSSVETQVAEAHSKQYSSAAAKIPFSSDYIDEKKPMWEEMDDVYLLYDWYLECTDDVAEVGNFRNKYRERFVDLSDLPDFDVTKLVKIAHEYYETDILPHTDWTLHDIENMTPELKERMKSDPKLYQAEYWLRVKECTNKTDDKNLYHIARSADDVFKIMCNDRNRSISAKEAVFYASNAIAFYCACIQRDEGNIDRKFVYYRMAEIYIYLFDYVEFVNQDDDHNIHALLMADVLLSKAEAEYEFENIVQNMKRDIHQKLPLFSFYRMRVLKELIFKYKIHDEKIVRECADRALQFWNSSYSEGYERCQKGCWDTLKNLNNEFPELGLPKAE